MTQLSPIANLGIINSQKFSELLLGVSIPSWFGSIQLLSNKTKIADWLQSEEATCCHGPTPVTEFTVLYSKPSVTHGFK